MRRISCSLVATVCLLGVAGSAVADEHTEDTEDATVSARAARPFAINLSVGTGTEFGIISVERNWPLASGLSVDAGVGLGLAGIKARVFPKLEKRLSNHGWLTLGAGLTAGQHRWIEQSGFCFQESCATKSALFGISASTTAAIEYRGSSGWQVGPYIGAEVLLNGSAMECVGSEESVEHCERDHTDEGVRRVFTGLRFRRTF